MRVLVGSERHGRRVEIGIIVDSSMDCELYDNVQWGFVARWTAHELCSNQAIKVTSSLGTNV